MSQGCVEVDEEFSEANKLAADNVRLVFDFARKNTAISKVAKIDADEFSSRLMEVLIQASRKYDPFLGFRFSTLLWRFMRNECSQILRESQQVRRGGRIRINQFAIDDEGGERLPSVKCRGETDQVDARDLIHRKWWKLNTNERAVLRGRFWNDETLQDIADRIGVSKERIRQIEVKALNKLRF